MRLMAVQLFFSAASQGYRRSGYQPEQLHICKTREHAAALVIAANANQLIG